jgi:hypothetical protein
MSVETLAGADWRVLCPAGRWEREARFFGGAGRGGVALAVRAGWRTGYGFTGRGGEDGCGEFQDLDIFAEPAGLPA